MFSSTQSINDAPDNINIAHASYNTVAPYTVQRSVFVFVRGRQAIYSLAGIYKKLNYRWQTARRV